MDGEEGVNGESVPAGLPLDPTLTHNPNATASTFVGETAPLGETRPLAPRPGKSPAEIDTPRVEGEFELRRVLGRGGFGVVYEGVQLRLSRLVAIKKVREDRGGSGGTPADSGTSDSIIRSFRGEALTSAQLDHPNIVPVYDLGTDSRGLPLLAMKLVAGSAWNRLIDDEWKSLPAEDFLARHIPILVDVAQAVSFAHSRGIVHRDLKPSQVMIGEFGEVLLMDWGLALTYEEALLPRTRLEGERSPAPLRGEASNPAGTPAFMAPEQTEPTAENLGPWTDVYLLGGMLFHLLTHGYPHPALSSTEAFREARLGILADPEVLAPGREKPRELMELALHALSSRPDDRPPTAKAFLARLNDYLSGAGRRRESTALTSSAAEALASVPRDYDTLSESVASLGRAHALWPANPQVPVLRQRALGAFSEAALANGDFVLARVQSGRMEPTADRAAIERRINAAQARAAADARVRRGAVAGVIVLSLVVAAGSFLFSQRLAREVVEKESARQEALASKDAAERSLGIADAQGDGAHEIISYFLRDLKVAMDEELTPDRGVTVPEANDISHAIAGRVAGPVVGFLAGMDTASWPEEMRLEHASRMLATATRFLELGRAAEALALTTPTLALREELLGAEHALVAEALAVQGGSLHTMGEYASARPTLERALAIRESALGPDDPDTAASLSALATLLVSMAAYEDALPLHERALSIRENTPGLEPAELVESLNYTAMMHLTTGDYDKARERQERALQVAEAAAGPDAPLTAQSAYNLGTFHQNRGEYAEAAPLLERAIAIREKVLGPRHPQTGTSLGKHASLLLAMGRPAEARPLFERALAIHEETLGPMHSDTAACLTNLAHALSETGEYDAARALHERALDISVKAVGPDHPSTAVRAISYGLFLRRIGEHAQALAQFERALAIHEQVHGPDHESTGLSLHNIALCHHALGDLAAALPPTERAVAIMEKTLGPEHPKLATSLTNLASLHLSMRKPELAEPLLERALAINEKVHGVMHSMTAQTLNTLGGLHGSQRNFAEARPFHERALEIQREVLGPRHPGTLTTLSNLAMVTGALGDLAGARTMFESVIETRGEIHGPRHPDTAAALAVYASVLRDNGACGEAVPLLERALSIRIEAFGEDNRYTVVTRQALLRCQVRLARAETDPVRREESASAALAIVVGHPEAVGNTQVNRALHAEMLALLGRTGEAAEEVSRLLEVGYLRTPIPPEDMQAFEALCEKLGLTEAEAGEEAP